MKPNFALSLSFKGIRLLHRAAGGWRIVGEVGLEAEDLAGELAVLRRTATALDPSGMRTKLLLPETQIKYLTLDTPGLGRAARLDAARSALDGATPYDVDDLAFDICADGKKTHVAAVARETMAEAEAFASEHRFNPICFAAVPDAAPFMGEPYFGPTRAANALLEPGEEVEVDGIAVVVVGDAELDPPVSDGPEDAAPAAEEELQTKDPALADDAIDAVPEQEEPAAPAAPLFRSRAAKQEEATPGDAESVSETTPEPEPDQVTDPTAPQGAPKPTPFKSAERLEEPEEEEVSAPKADPSPPVLPSLGPASRSATAAAGSIPPAPPVPTPGFSSRRSADPSPTLKRREPVVTSPAPLRTPEPIEPAEVVREETLPVDETIGVAPAIPRAPAIPPQAPAAQSPIAAASAAAAPIGRFLSRRRSSADGSPKLRSAVLQPAGAAMAPSSEAERMTVFGARRNDVGGKPRFLGLMLTAALLLFLAGVAAWASVFLDDGLNLSRLFGDREPRATASAPVEPATPAEPEGVQTASLDAELTEEDTAVLDALREPVAPQIEELSPQELEARYAATGIWPLAPEVPPEPAALIDIDDLYLTSIDPVSTATDAVALPEVGLYGTDLALDNVSSPAAAGTRFALNAQGLVIPTAAGALSPDGHTVYLGRPPAVPPATPTRFQAVPQDTAVRTALAAFRPQSRPDDLSETNERATLGGLTRNELAGFRPQLRPKSVQEKADAAAAEAAAEAAEPPDTSEAVEEALAEPQDTAFDNPTRLAIKASARPDTRPRNFARIVRRAQRTPQPQAQEEQVAARQVAPRTVTPKIPSNTSVAKQATVRNAINLRKVNLIGVYGKPSSRRALVRLGNGRYKKVVVGDRLDGGRVSAIGDSELRYSKGGRNIVLKMPRG